MSIKNLRQKGFSVIELVIALSLFIIISLFLAYLVFYQYWIFNAQNSEIQITNYARAALSTIDNYARQSNLVLSSYSNYQTGSQTLVLEMNSIDSSNQIIEGSYDTIVFYLSETDLMMQLFPGNGSIRSAITKKIAGNIKVSDFSFSYDNPDYSLTEQITTNIAIEQTFNGFENNQRSISISSKSKLRNH